METIFSKLRRMQTEGKSLGDLIAQASDAGDALVEALDPTNVRAAAQLLNKAGHGLHAGLMILMADAQDRALAAAYPKDSNGNGASKAA